MRRKRIRFSWIISMFSLSVCLFGCAKEEDNKIDLVDIKVDKSGPFYMLVNETQEVSATPVPLNTTEDVSLVWESSASSVATVSNSGLITAVGEGEAVIKAALGGFKKEIAVYVSLTPWEVPVTDIRLSDAGPLRIPVNNKVQITAVAEPVNTTDVSPLIWSSGDETIATVSDEGLITAVAVGKTTIKVSKGGISKEISVSVIGLQRVGSWLCANPDNPAKATVGSDLIPYKMNGNKTTGVPDPTFEGFSVVDGPNGTYAVRVPKQSYLFCNHGIEQVSGDYVNEYTILIHFRSPTGTRTSFFQTDLTNQNDVDCFLRPNMTQIGMVGFYADIPAIAANRWYRLVISAKLGEGGWLQYYLDGKQIYDLHGGTFGAQGQGRTQLNSEGSWHKDGLMLCADEDGEDEIMDVTEIGIWEVALTPEQVATIEYK